MTVGGRNAWTIVTLVFLFMLINFADKAVVGLSSTAIIKELGLNHAQFGALGSAFFLLFSISGVVIGFLSNRIPTKRIMLVLSVVWALALLPMTGTVSFAGLLGSRIILGAAEGPAFPIALHAVYKWFGDKRRAVPTSVVACGASFGTGVVAPLITWIIVHYSWHVAFAVLGVAGLAWAIVWAVVGEDGPVGRSIADGVAPARIPYRYLILSRTALGVYIAGFAAYWMIALNIVWLANSIHTLAGLIAPVAMGLIVDVGANPVDGFRTGYLYAGLLVVTLGLVAALLIHPEADLRRFRKHGIAPAAAGDAMSSTHTRSHVSARLPEGGLAD